MTASYQPSWVPRLFFWLTVGLAGTLLLGVGVAPWFVGSETQVTAWGRLVRLFAQDATLRRTMIASAVGLIVTACVFFNPPANPWRSRSRSSKAPPPPNVVGA